MSNKVISILGCGWLGKPLGKVLVDDGYSVKGSTTRNENVAALAEAGIIPFVFNVDEPLDHDVTHAFFNTDILIISLPHRARAGKADEYLQQIRNVTARVARTKVKGVILISTTSVYPNLNRVVSEEDADPQNVFVDAERIVRDSGIPNNIIRMAGLFGPGRHPGRFLSGKREVSGGDIPVNLIHLDDCIGIIKSLIENDVWNEVLNACADDHPTRDKFYTQAAIELGLEPPVFSDNRQADYKIVSNERLKSVLRYEFIHRLT